MIQERTGDDPMKVFKKAVENVKPRVEVKSRRVGGSTYQVPIEVRPEPQAGAVHPLADRQRADAQREDDEAAAGQRADGAATNRGRRIKKKEDTHRMAEANKAFAHYRW